MVMLLAVLLAGGLSACAQQQRLDAVLGDVAEKRDEIDTAYLRWGSVEMFMEEPAQIEQLWQELQQLPGARGTSTANQSGSSYHYFYR